MPLRKFRSIPQERRSPTSSDGEQDEVDAQAHPAVEVALAVVPPREARRLGLEHAEGVDEAAALEHLGERGALLGLDVGLAREGRGVVDVAVGRADVHVAADRGRRAAESLRPRRHRAEEGELLRVGLGPDGAAVRDVDGGHAHPAHRGLDEARLLGKGLARQAPDGILEPEPRAGQDRHAGPAPAGVVHRLVARRAQLGRGERGGLALRLLQAGDVRRVKLEELEDPREAHLEAVDVPGDEAHGPPQRIFLTAMFRDPNVCPKCGSRVSPFAAGCAICGADLPPYAERHRKSLAEQARAKVRALRAKRAGRA